MQTISIIGYQRTGSSWLSNAFAGCDSYSAFELISADPLLFYWRMIFLLRNIYKVDTAILETFAKIYLPDNFFVDIPSNFAIKRKILASKPYSRDLLKAFQNILYSNNLNFIFKVFPENLIHNDVSIFDIENISDYIIINYRNDIIKSFISESKAIATNKWSILETSKQYQEKIYWNLDSYNDYLVKTLNKISVLEDYYARIKKPCVKISYESIHCNNTEDDKLNRLNQCLLDIDQNFKWNFNTDNFYKKENMIQNLEDNFYNPIEFKHDLSKIRRYIYE